MKVIYICGANHSGSTLMGSVLGSDPDGPFKNFHVGELHAFFIENGKLYGDPRHAARDECLQVWGQIDPKVTYENAYQEIARYAPNLEVIIDSSKRAKDLERHLVKPKPIDKSLLHCVVTYRPFEKIWQSDADRNNAEKIRIRNLQGYEKLYQLIDDNQLKYTVINMDDLVINPAKLTKTICDQVGIQYFEGKENYWNFPHCHLYGATTQKKHLVDKIGGVYNKEKALAKVSIQHEFFDRYETKKLEERLQSESITL